MGWMLPAWASRMSDEPQDSSILGFNARFVNLRAEHLLCAPMRPPPD